MKKLEALKVIEAEELNKYRKYSFDGENITENMTGIRKTSEGWQCFETSERGGIEVIDTYEKQEDAIDNMIEGLRVYKRMALRRRG